ncbi:MAG: PqiC family protein [Proteobacteria bacterium]|nr:PqiC family protein [Pseudomonadota bacterium]MDA1300684.1 PqiC family protein [Pseudomonadota bacterium]
MKAWFWLKGMGWTLLIVTVLLAGCSSSSGPGIRYYILDPGQAVQLLVQPQLSLEIVDLQIPQYLERYQLVTRTTENQLSFSEGHQWGDNLRKNLTRTLADNLSASLGTVDIGTPENRTASAPDYRIQVYITRFERDVDRNVRLNARWQISETTGNNARVSSHAFGMSHPRTLESGDYAGTVAAMEEVFTRLCDAIAEDLIARLQDQDE